MAEIVVLVVEMGVVVAETIVITVGVVMVGVVCVCDSGGVALAAADRGERWSKLEEQQH